MKERPILMSAPMVLALLAGAKTQTRRVIRNPEKFSNIRNCGFRCPYGRVGDRLWVRETFFHDPDFHGTVCTWYRAEHDTFPGLWSPSIFMPRRLSRISLEIFDIDVERLQEICPTECIAEGTEYAVAKGTTIGALTAYQILWDSINAKRGFGWVANPWVWVISFKVIKPDPSAQQKAPGASTPSGASAT